MSGFTLTRRCAAPADRVWDKVGEAVPSTPQYVPGGASEVG